MNPHLKAIITFLVQGFNTLLVLAILLLAVVFITGKQDKLRHFFDASDIPPVPKVVYFEDKDLVRVPYPCPRNFRLYSKCAAMCAKIEIEGKPFLSCSTAVHQQEQYSQQEEDYAPLSGFVLTPMINKDR